MTPKKSRLKDELSQDVQVAARAYLARDWMSVPIPAGQKGPRLDGWQNFRLKEEEVKDHFAQGSNIGLLLGKPSGGLVDVDIDHPAALRQSGQLPPTERVHGRGQKPNSHHWYKCAGEIPETKRFQDPVTRETLIEFRSTGGQTVVPPSVYHVDGVEDRLVWVRHGEPAAIDGNTLLRRVANVAARALLAKHYPSEAGSRHDLALALSGFLLRGGMQETEAESLIETVCECAGDDEVEDRIRTVTATAATLRAGQPATGRNRLTEYFDPRVISKVSEWLGLSESKDAPGWDAPIPFGEVRTPEISADVLPGKFAAFARALAEAAEVPESMTVMTTLGAISAAVTKKFVATPKPGWFEPLNIYAMISLPPANNKSFVLREATAPIDRWEFERQVAMQAEVRTAQSTRRNEESTIASLRQRAARSKSAESRQMLFKEVTDLEARLTPVPVPPKVYLNDVTPESLAAAIAEQGGKMAIISDEGGITETLAGLYSSGRANYDIVLKGYDGGKVRLKRKEREVDIRPYISLLLLVQPRVLRNMAQQRAFEGRGLFERILYLIPASKLGHRTLDTKPVPVEVSRALELAMRKLLDLDIPRDGLGIEDPRLLSLSPEAKECWTEFRRDIERGLDPNGRLNGCAGWGGKIPGTCVRIAGLLHVAEHGQSNSVIGNASMKRAVTICHALVEHALAAFSMMQTDEATQDAEAIYQWILGRGEARFGRTDCLRKFHGRFTNKKRYEAALEALRHHNIISEMRSEADPATGRSRKYYEINPMLFDRKA